MEEFKDACQSLDVRIEEIAVDLRDLPTDYKLAERYTQIDQEIYEMHEWYEKVKRERIQMEDRLRRVSENLRYLDNDVNRLKLREFSRARHGGSFR
jgi:5-bromo-4-chloroindolyl phosphate hydrolysis protein